MEVHVCSDPCRECEPELHALWSETKEIASRIEDLQMQMGPVAPYLGVEEWERRHGIREQIRVERNRLMALYESPCPSCMSASAVSR